MKLRVHYYRVAFRPDADFGDIQIYLENKESYRFKKLSAQKFNALINVLTNEPVFWDGTWLSTKHELVED